MYENKQCNDTWNLCLHNTIYLHAFMNTLTLIMLF